MRKIYHNYCLIDPFKIFKSIKFWSTFAEQMFFLPEFFVAFLIFILRPLSCPQCDLITKLSSFYDIRFILDFLKKSPSCHLVNIATLVNGNFHFDRFDYFMLFVYGISNQELWSSLTPKYYPLLQSQGTNNLNNFIFGALDKDDGSWHPISKLMIHRIKISP